MSKRVKKAALLFMAAILIFSFFGCSAIVPPQTSAVQETQDTAADISAGTETQALKSESSEAVMTEKPAVYSQEDIFTAIENLVESQKMAIVTGDSELIEQTINPVDSFLKAEARHLAADQQVFPVSNYSRTVSDLYKEGAYYYGTLEQSFIYQGEDKKSSELRIYMFEDGVAYDMGTVLQKEMWGNIFIAFPEGEYALAENLCETTSRYVEAVNALWGQDFSQSISIKIYDDKDVFLNSIKLSLPDWAGGWYENGESIKTYIYDAAPGRYEYLMRHEATHMMLSYATNDNAAYWMQEGFATTLPTFIADGRLEINRKDVLEEAFSQGVLPTVKQHVNTNIEELTDMFDVRLYYGYSSAMAVYMMQKMDQPTLKRLFYELKTYPYIALTMSEKAFDTQTITEKCFKKATGSKFYDYFDGFENWLNSALS